MPRRKRKSRSKKKKNSTTNGSSASAKKPASASVSPELAEDGDELSAANADVSAVFSISPKSETSVTEDEPSQTSPDSSDSKTEAAPMASTISESEIEPKIADSETVTELSDQLLVADEIHDSLEIEASAKEPAADCHSEVAAETEASGSEERVAVRHSADDGGDIGVGAVDDGANATVGNGLSFEVRAADTSPPPLAVAPSVALRPFECSTEVSPQLSAQMDLLSSQMRNSQKRLREFEANFTVFSQMLERLKPEKRAVKALEVDDSWRTALADLRAAHSSSLALAIESLP